MRHSFLEILNMAGYAMWVIFACSILAIAIGLNRLVALWRFKKEALALHDNVLRCLGKGAKDEALTACQRSSSPLADVYLAGFERAGRADKETVVAVVTRARLRLLSGLKTYLWILGTIGATAPFIGLFGTVIGIMDGLGDISETGKNDLAIVAGPISEALYATAAGILVAVEAVVLFNYFNQVIGGLALDTRLLCDEFCEELCATSSVNSKSAHTPSESED